MFGGAVSAGAANSNPGEDARALVLRAESLSCGYGAVEVFRDVSLSMHAGEVTFLVGANGSGKSTLLRCLAGWDAPHAGEVEFLGERLSSSKRESRRLMSYVPDVPVFYDDLTAQEHIRFVLAANRADDRTHARAQELLEEFGLADHVHSYPSSYSRGMRQKLALVLACMGRPRLLLLDEPYGPLDPTASRVLSALLMRACAAGAAVLVSCHHEVPALVPDRVLRLGGDT